MNNIKNGVKQVNQIFVTRNYEMFKFRKDNRELRHYHITDLMKSMKERGWIKGSYVVINEKNEIIDGQHRFESGRRLNLPIMFTIEKGTNFDDIQDLNQLQVNWSKGEHINGWVKKGNPSYVILEQFQKDYSEFKLTEQLMVLGNTTIPIKKGDFTSGKFVVKSLKIGSELLNKLRQLKPYFENHYYKSVFVRSMLTMIINKKDKFDFDEFLHKVQLRPTMLVQCGTKEQYYEVIENIYNFKRSNKVNLRF
jgi:hypothetical protein